MTAELLAIVAAAGLIAFSAYMILSERREASQLRWEVARSRREIERLERLLEKADNRWLRYVTDSVNEGES